MSGQTSTAHSAEAGAHAVVTRLSGPGLRGSLAAVWALAASASLASSSFAGPMLAAGGVPTPWLWSLFGGAIVWAAVISVVLVRRYPRVEWNETACIVRVRGREVPADEIIELRRRYSGWAFAHALEYAFASESGTAFRLLVSAKPLPSMTPDGLAGLARFVLALQVSGHARLPIERNASNVDREVLLYEVRCLGILPSITGIRDPEQLAFEEKCRVDDEAATRLLEPVSERYRRIDSLSRAVIATATAAGLLCVLGSMVAEAAHIAARHVLGPALLTAIGVGLLAQLVRASAVRRADRAVMRMSDTWWDEADDLARHRGQPVVYTMRDARHLGLGPALRALSLSVLGAGAVTAMFFLGDGAPWLAAWLWPPGLIAVYAGFLGAVASLRRRSTAFDRIRRRAGRRSDPPGLQGQVSALADPPTG
ncbi:hypothetical protein [Agromyces archimandritae]|uniref:Uncharacterized protein n=1 Tax=Agromyces archimandritae TaxID=2781962 RepID=A0A975IQ02_9MICO|nr:hypothetical protein [Agromyces archimandritae]QTX05839.1 hypothetical protein G127AT_06480 [Agromyces archimandritae]